MKKKNQEHLFNSLYWRISSVFLCILGVIGLAYVYITLHYSGQYFQQVIQRLNRSVATDIVASAKPILNKKVNQPALEKVFNSVMSVNPSLEVYLLDTDGKILSYFAPKKKIILNKINLTPLQEFISSKGNKYILGDDPRHPGEKKVFSVAPVISNGLVSGYIYVVLASEKYAEVSDFLKGDYLKQVGTGVMILTLLATLVIGLLVFRIITNNYTKIIDVMQKYRQGELTARVNVRSTGDVKQLADIFNEMADILTQNMEKLKAVEVLRRELIANVSHDLRTPISIIHGYIETLQMKEDTLSSADRKRYMNTILESTEKLKKLVDELFELSKLEANQVQPKKEPFFISELVSDISNKYHLIAKDKNISINTVFTKDLPPVYADISLIERVMQNLIDNAIKFTPAGGNIIIKTHKSEGNVEVIVTDTGVGIPENERESIYGRYYKANNFTDLKNSTGLGLAIVKKILDLHDSSLDLVSNVATGSSFVFRLPVYQSN